MSLKVFYLFLLLLNLQDSKSNSTSNSQTSISTTTKATTNTNPNSASNEYKSSIKIMFEEIQNHNLELININTKEKPAFTYQEEEPIWPISCFFGSKQSPIDLPVEMKFLNRTKIIKVVEHNYKKIYNLPLSIVHNSIHALKFEDFSQGYVIISKNDINYKFNISQIQFHFPTEHMLGGEKLDLEMHLIHYKDQNYLENELKLHNLERDPDYFDLLNIAILFQSIDLHTNLNIQKLKVNSLGPVLGFDIGTYIPKDTPFYFYEGSETNPLNLCKENVNWIIPIYRQYISREQLKYFVNWMLTTAEMTGNTRSIQQRNNRQIYYQYYRDNSNNTQKNISKNHQSTMSASSRTYKPLFHILNIIIIVYFLFII